MKKYITLCLALVCSLLFAQQGPNEEMAQLKSKVALDPDNSALLLVKINRLYHQTGDIADALKYYEEIEQKYQGKEVSAAAACIAVPYLTKTRKFSLVIQKCTYVKDNFKGTEWAANCLYLLGELYLNDYQDKETADKYFRELIKECPNSSLAPQAKAYLGPGN